MPLPRAFLFLTHSGKSPEPFAYDLPRTGRAVFYGFFIHAPLSHVHYNFLEYLTVKIGVKGIGITIFKTFMEQVRLLGAVYWSWLLPCVCIRHLTVPNCLRTFFSLSIGVGSPTHCITVLWEPCRDSLQLKSSTASRLFSGTHKRLSGSFGFPFNLSTFVSCRCATI